MTTLKIIQKSILNVSPSYSYRTTYYSLWLSEKKHSTNIATIELTTKISQGIDNNEHTLGVF